MNLVFALAAAILGQSNAKDWIRTNKVNWRLAEHLEFITTRLRPLLDAALSGPAGGVDALGQGIREQAAGIGLQMLLHSIDYIHVQNSQMARPSQY